MKRKECNAINYALKQNQTIKEQLNAFRQSIHRVLAQLLNNFVTKYMLCNGFMLKQMVISKSLISSMIFNAFLTLLAASQTNGELEKGLMEHVTQLSQQQCVYKCEQLQNCLSAVYNRPLALCKLYKIIPDKPSKSGVTV